MKYKEKGNIKWRLGMGGKGREEERKREG